MSTGSTQKLTKKQKKAAAFRQRKHATKDMEINGVPEMETQDIDDAEADQVETESVEETQDKTEQIEDPPTSKKRKRDQEVEKDENKAKQRFILFVGNLKYTTSKEAIATHFSKCDPPPSVRLLTPKSAKSTVKSKGCAFLEFSHRNALQQALKLHQSELEGRMINVELTAGGGGKGASRTEKLRERNKDLFGQRSKRLKKSPDDTEALLQRPQRFSSTSGIEKPVLKRRTWTVGDVDDEQTHRGGKSKTRGKRTKNWGTGANMIPVG